MTKVVQIPESDWLRITRILDRFDKSLRADKPRQEWITAGVFMSRTGKTKEQLKGFRDRHPEMVKPKPGCEVQGRYLYNYTAYQSFYYS